MDVEVGPQDLLKGGIKWQNRDRMGNFQMGCGFLGFVLIFLQIIVSFVLIGSTNGYIDFGAGDCPTGLGQWGLLCVSQELVVEQEACPPKYDFSSTTDFGGFRRRLHQGRMDMDSLDSMDMLSASTMPGDAPILRRLTEEGKYSMWDRMSQNSEVPGVLMPLLLIVGLLWILLLQKAALPCIVGAIVFSVLICIFLALFPMFVGVHMCTFLPWDAHRDYPMANDKASDDWCRSQGGVPEDRSGSLIWVFLIPAVVMIGLSYYYREAIKVAAMCLSKCCLALRQDPMILLAASAVFASFLIYQGLWIGAILSVPKIFESNCDAGDITIKDNSDLIQILAILLTPSYIYFEMMIIVVASCGVGGWYFVGNPTAPTRPAVEGLKWAYTTSSGAVFLSTIITWPIVEIRNYVHGKMAKFALFPCLPCSWLYWIFYILWCCVLRAYMAFTRFMLIAHTFHGGDIFKVARQAWVVLKKHLGGAVVTDSVASLVLNMGVQVISIAFAIAAWAWMEKAIGKGFLADLFSGADATGSMIMVILLLIVLMWFCNHSLFTIILIAFTANLLNDVPAIHGFMCGLFVGAVCNVVFCFIAKVIHAGMDTIFYCFALESEYATGHTRDGITDLGDMIKRDVVQPVPDYLKEDYSKEGETAVGRR